MYQGYFDYNGKRYYTGTVFIVRKDGKEVKATYIGYNTEYTKYNYEINGCKYIVDENYFYNALIAVTEGYDCRASLPIKKQMKESEIDGMIVGWIWYIVLMLISSIFKANVGLWILISIVFFGWRAKKKKESVYIDWDP